MKQAPALSTLMVAVVLFTASCGNKKDSAALKIPKQAAFVVHINSSSLTSKLSWKDIQASSWFKKAAADTRDSLSQEIMDNPEASGIHTGKDMTFFMSKQGKGGIAVFEGSVKNAGDFEKFNRKRLEEDGEVGKTEKDGDIHFLQSEESSLIAWDDSRFFYISDAPMNSQANYGLEGDQNYGTVSFGKDSLKKFVKQLMDLSGSNNLANDDRFESMLKEDGDIHFWTNMEENPAMNANPAMDFMGMGKMLEGMVSASSINFDEGKITWKTKSYMSEELAKISEKYSNKTVSTDLVNKIPSQNVIMAVALNYQPEYLRDFIKAAGFEGVVNGYLGRFNYTLNDLVKSHKGEMLFSVSDIGMKTVQRTIEGTDQIYSSPEPTAKMLFALSVGDKTSMDKMVGLVENTINQNGGTFPKDLSYKSTTDWFVAGNDAEQVNQFLGGSKSNMPFASRISGHPFGMYIDIQKGLASAKSFVPAGMAGFDLAMKTWQDVVITGGEFKDGYYTSTIEINFVDKKTNSLKQINNFIDQMAAGSRNANAYEPYEGEAVPPQEDVQAEVAPAK